MKHWGFIPDKRVERWFASNLIQIKRHSVEKGCLNNNLETCRNWIVWLHFSTPRSPSRHAVFVKEIQCLWGAGGFWFSWFFCGTCGMEKWMTEITKILLCGFFRNSVVRFPNVQLFLDSGFPLHHKCHWCFTSWLPGISSFHICFL